MKLVGHLLMPLTTLALVAGAGAKDVTFDGDDAPRLALGLSMNGDVRVGETDASLAPTIFREGWSGSSTGVRRDLKFPDAATGTAEVEFFGGKNEKFADGRITRRETPDGRAAFDATLTSARDQKPELVALVLTLPCAAFGNATWTTSGGKTGVLAKTWDGKAHELMNASVKWVEIAPRGRAAFRLEFPAPTRVQLNDGRRWQSTYSLRIWPADGNGRAFGAGAKKSFACTISAAKGAVNVSIDEPVVVKAGADWIPIDGRDDILPDSALDFSQFGALDAPAGRYGWLRAEGEHFVFENRPGVPVRFYGVNLCFEANFPKDADEAERLVAHLRRRGYNAIRLHHYDRFLTEASEDGVSLDPKRADRLDLLVAAAIRHGMYLTTDLFVSRPVRYRQIGIDRDGQVNGQVFKSLTDLYEPAFENWAAFARNFLEHVNPYTGRAYKDEPAMPLLCAVNEGGLFMGWWYTGKTTEPVIVEAWRKWVEEKRRADPSFHPEVSPDVVPATPYDRRYSAAFAMFQADVEAAGFAKKKAFLRSLGVKAMLTSDNSGPHWASLQATTDALDYVDDHFYQDHPQFLGARWGLPTKAKCENPVLDKSLQCCTSPYTRMAGKPFTVTEFAFCAPSPYRAQGGLLVGAQAALQDWGGLWHFSLDRIGSRSDGSRRIGFFSTDSDPVKRTVDRAIMALFLRGDMEPFPAEKGVSLLITGESIDPKATTAAFRSSPSWMADVCWKRRTSSSLDRAAAGAATVIPRERAEEPEMQKLATDVPPDPRIVFDRKAGGFAVSTPRTAGGFADAGKSFDADAVCVSVSNAAATVWATSLDGRPLDESRRILLTHVTDVQNENAMFKDATFSELRYWGESPLVRVGSAEVSLRHAHPETCRVWALRPDGTRKCEVPTSIRDGRLVLRVSIAAPDPSLHYEIVCPYRNYLSQNNAS